MKVLSANDLQFFQDSGYVIVPNAVSQANLDAVIAAIYDFLKAGPDDPATWYDPARRGHAIVHLHQHQALWIAQQPADRNPRAPDLSRRPPHGDWARMPDVFQGRETKYPVAKLSPLGRKLLGVDVWER